MYKKEHGTFKKASDLTEDEAATMIQSMFKVRRSRLMVQKLMRATYEKVYDESTGGTYYFNKKTGESSWTKPINLGSSDAPLTPRSAGVLGEADSKRPEGDPSPRPGSTLGGESKAYDDSAGTPPRGQGRGGGGGGASQDDDDDAGPSMAGEGESHAEGEGGEGKGEGYHAHPSPTGGGSDSPNVRAEKAYDRYGLVDFLDECGLPQHLDVLKNEGYVPTTKESL